MENSILSTGHLFCFLLEYFYFAFLLEFCLLSARFYYMSSNFVIALFVRGKNDILRKKYVAFFIYFLLLEKKKYG